MARPSRRPLAVGTRIGERAKAAGVTTRVFDGAAFATTVGFAGRADGAREAGSSSRAHREVDETGTPASAAESGALEMAEGQLEERVIAINRVAKVRQGRSAVLVHRVVVVGDGDGNVGLGTERPRSPGRHP